MVVEPSDGMSALESHLFQFFPDGMPLVPIPDESHEAFGIPAERFLEPVHLVRGGYRVRQIFGDASRVRDPGIEIRKGEEREFFRYFFQGDLRSFPYRTDFGVLPPERVLNLRKQRHEFFVRKVQTLFFYEFQRLLPEFFVSGVGLVGFRVDLRDPGFRQLEMGAGCARIPVRF